MKLFTTIMMIFSLSACTQSKIHNGKIRLGYLLNMTHAVPIVGLEQNAFENIEAKYFFAGGDLINSLATGNIDIAYLGPGPFINASSKGIELLLLSGSSYGGNAFVISEKSKNKANLKNIGVPQYGNTQDLLARKFLDEKYNFIAVNPAEMETAFYTNAVDAALLAEPWGSLLESKGARIDEEISKNLNKYPAALLVVYKPFYEKNKSIIDDFVIKQNSVIEYVTANKPYTINLVKKHIENIAKKELKQEILEKSFSKISFSNRIDISLLNDMMQISKNCKYIRNELDLNKLVSETQKSLVINNAN